MRILSINKGEDKVLSMRLFNANSKNKFDFDLDLASFARAVGYRFEVLEVGIPIITKENNELSMTRELEGFPANIMNISFRKVDTKDLRSNPSTADRIRTFKFWGIDSERREFVLEQGYFYVEEL